MLLADEPLELLIEQLILLAPADRHAVLARLSRTERAKIKTAMRTPATPAPEAPGYAADIAARMVAPMSDPAMTAAGRAAMARAIRASGMMPGADAVHALTAVRPASLVDRMLGWLEGGRR